MRDRPKYVAAVLSALAAASLSAAAPSIAETVNKDYDFFAGPACP